MEAALEWGLCPDEWRQKSIDDRARMLAHGWIKATREAYAAEGRLFEAERGKDEKPNAAGGMAAEAGKLRGDEELRAESEMSWAKN